MEEEYQTVTQINNYLGKKFKNDNKLRNIYVRGEISNYKTYLGRHSYFTLKDENSQIPGVIYLHQKKFLKFKPKNGMKVIVRGSVEVYEKNGKYQLVAYRITEDGLGDLHIAFEQLKEKLDKEGLFDESHKKEIPKFPKRIGVVTAQNSAAVRDIITTIQRRWQYCELLIFSTLVQGDLAAPQIVRQIKRSKDYDLDLLIVGRGGGSIEDLWAFNEEIVARAIYECETPVISAVGHQIDYTISDFVADLRAPTPTAAAELAVPDKKEIEYKIKQYHERITKDINNKITADKSKIENIVTKQIFKNPHSIYEIKGQELDNLINKIDFTSKNLISENKNKLIKIENSFILNNPRTLTLNKEEKLNKLLNKLDFSSKDMISENKNKLIKIENSFILKNPGTIHKDKELKLDNLIKKLTFTSKNIISENKNKLFKIENSVILKNPNEITKEKKDAYLKNFNKLEVLNPQKKIKRGYTLTKKDGKVISSSKDVKKDDELEIEFNDGKINTKVI